MQEDGPLEQAQLVFDVENCVSAVYNIVKIGPQVAGHYVCNLKGHLYHTGLLGSALSCIFLQNGYSLLCQIWQASASLLL